jgi:hypothetical protein
MTAFLFGNLSISYDDPCWPSSNNNEFNGRSWFFAQRPQSRPWLALTILPRGLHRGRSHALIRTLGTRLHTRSGSLIVRKRDHRPRAICRYLAARAHFITVSGQCKESYTGRSKVVQATTARKDLRREETSPETDNCLSEHSHWANGMVEHRDWLCSPNAEAPKENTPIR